MEMIKLNVPGGQLFVGNLPADTDEEALSFVGSLIVRKAKNECKQNKWWNML